MRMYNRFISQIYQLLPTIIAIMVVINGLLYTFDGLLYLYQLPDLDTAMKYLGKIDIFQKHTSTSGFSLVFGPIGLIIGIGLYKHLRIAWIWSVIFLIIIIIINLFSWKVSHFLYYSMFALISLLLSYKLFNKGEMKYTQLYVLFSIIFSLAYGVIGTYLLRDGFDNVSNWIDALYYTIVTYSTVGYGDITPISSIAKLYSCTMILIGLSSFATVISTYIVPAIGSKIKNMQIHLHKNNSDL
ncbi:MAG: voltage-gated potassium channel [Francisellaceae bacterium]|jgi:voltage-gated potassium channel